MLRTLPLLVGFVSMDVNLVRQAIHTPMQRGHINLDDDIDNDLQLKFHNLRHFAGPMERDAFQIRCRHKRALIVPIGNMNALLRPANRYLA